MYLMRFSNTNTIKMHEVDITFAARLKSVTREVVFWIQ